MNAGRRKEIAKSANFVGNKGIVKNTTRNGLKKNRRVLKKSIKVR